MKVNIYASDKMVYGVELPGGAVLASEVIDKFTKEIKERGFYMYTSTRSSRSTSLPWHAITAIEQDDTIEDFPYMDKERFTLDEE